MCSCPADACDSVDDGEADGEYRDAKGCIGQSEKYAAV